MSITFQTETFTATDKSSEAYGVMAMAPEKARGRKLTGGVMAGLIGKILCAVGLHHWCVKDPSMVLHCERGCGAPERPYGE